MSKHTVLVELAPSDTKRDGVGGDGGGDAAVKPALSIIRSIVVYLQLQLIIVVSKDKVVGPLHVGQSCRTISEVEDSLPRSQSRPKACSSLYGDASKAPKVLRSQGGVLTPCITRVAIRIPRIEIEYSVRANRCGIQHRTVVECRVPVGSRKAGPQCARARVGFGPSGVEVHDQTTCHVLGLASDSKKSACQKNSFPALQAHRSFFCCSFVAAVFVVVCLLLVVCWLIIWLVVVAGCLLLVVCCCFLIDLSKEQ